ncbi:glycosyltransferase family 4 protein [Candidatus Roizmanbacteria bacterium]|nr:glycosyltransferase family 4 protein [Candidatus Roizmanbacteria bacterium]
MNNLQNKRVGVDCGRYVPYGKVRNGIERILDSFVRSLSDVDKTNFYWYTFGRDEIDNFLLGRVRFLQARLFGSVGLPYNVLRDKCNVFLGFSGYSPPMLEFSKIHKIIFMYDTGFITKPEYYTNSNRLTEQTKQALEQANTVITLSETAKKQYQKAFPTKLTKKITVIHAGYDHLKGVRQKNIPGITSTEFFLYVGVIKPIKNIERILEIFTYYIRKNPTSKTKLVLVGKKESEYFQNLCTNEYFKESEQRLIFLDTISDAELVFLYKHAKAFLNMSREEGFCFPVGEALFFGCPVIVNKLPLYSEIKHEFPELSIVSTTREIVEKMNNSPRSSQRKISKQFTWTHFTTQLLKKIQTEV